MKAKILTFPSSTPAGDEDPQGDKLQRMRALLDRFVKRDDLSTDQRFELMREINAELEKQKEYVRQALLAGRAIEHGEYSAHLDEGGEVVIRKRQP
jgi:hypothetical protein